METNSNTTKIELDAHELETVVGGKLESQEDFQITPSYNDSYLGTLLG